MLFELSVDYNIESARYLSKLPSHHPCSRTHGHSFKLTFIFKGPLTEAGWVIDYNEISDKLKPLIQKIDHRLLNEIDGLENPTSEILCKWLFEKAQTILPSLHQVQVAETPATRCAYPG